MAQTPAPIARSPRVDAYAAWSMATSFRDSGRQSGSDWLWLILEVREPLSAKWLAQQAATSKKAGQWIWISEHYAYPPIGLEDYRFCTAMVSGRGLKLLTDSNVTPPDATSGAIRDAIERFELGFAGKKPGDIQGSDGRLTHAELYVSSQISPKVVMGIVDDGIAFANRRFCKVSQTGQRLTRFLGFWDQGQETVDNPWGVGRFYQSDDLDAALAQGGTDRAFDDDIVYRSAGYTEARHRVTHGTHVMDLACGADPVVDADDGGALPHIVGVQIPGAAVVDTTCASMAPFLLDAALYVIALADAARRGQSCQVIVNMSMGDIAGPHDGTSLFESAIDALIQCRSKTPAPCQVVLPEGNSYLSRCHAWVDMVTGSSFSIDWRIRPDDGTSSFVEVWLKPAKAKDEAAPRLSLQLQGPGVSSKRVTLSGSINEQWISDSRGQRMAYIGLNPQPANGAAILCLVAVAPTVCYDGWDRHAPSGVWTITVNNVGGRVECNAYVQRDDIAFGRRGRGRQSVFEEAIYRIRNMRGELDTVDDASSYTRRAGTINGLASGQLVEVVGGVTWQNGGSPIPARYSAVSNTNTPVATQQKRYMAVTEDSLVLHGIHASGTRSGTVAALSGTSMAAPQRARELADAVLKPPKLAGKARQTGPAMQRVSDFNGISRPLIAPATDLDARSRRRRASP